MQINNFSLFKMVNINLHPAKCRMCKCLSDFAVNDSQERGSSLFLTAPRASRRWKSGRLRRIYCSLFARRSGWDRNSVCHYTGLPVALNYGDRTHSRKCTTKRCVSKILLPAVRWGRKWKEGAGCFPPLQSCTSSLNYQCTPWPRCQC